VTVGWLRHDFVEHLRAFPRVFRIDAERIELAPALSDAAARTLVLAEIAGELVSAGVLPAARGELFPIAPRWSMPPLAELDRSWVTQFGIPAYGVHLNGYVGSGDGLSMWIARRARRKMTYPGQLDNIVAGGQPAGLGLFENMVKEAAEEAAIPPDLAGNIIPIGQVSYVMETEDGLKLDTLFNFDLAMPADFVPENTDGEVDEFMLMPLRQVAEIVRDSFEFKFNCSLVVIDFLIRHGYLSPDEEPDYAALCRGLQSPLPV
jgi:hypothetical protein